MQTQILRHGYELHPSMFLSIFERIVTWVFLKSPERRFVLTRYMYKTFGECTVAVMKSKTVIQVSGDSKVVVSPSRNNSEWFQSADRSTGKSLKPLRHHFVSAQRIAKGNDTSADVETIRQLVL